MTKTIKIVTRAFVSTGERNEAKALEIYRVNQPQQKNLWENYKRQSMKAEAAIILLHV